MINRFPAAMPPTHVQHYGPKVEGNQQPFFQYSQCTGRKKALCVRPPFPTRPSFFFSFLNKFKTLDWHKLHWTRIRIKRLPQ